MNYNAVLAKKDGSYIPIRHDFDTHYGFVQDFMREQKDALRNGHLQIVVGDLIIDIDDISHIQPVYEDDEIEEQGGTKGMQLYGEGFMAEGDPRELAEFAKNLVAVEISMSNCCEDKPDCCGECDCEKNTNELKLDENGGLTFSGTIGVSPYTYGLDVGSGSDHSAIVLQLPNGMNFEERSSYLVKHIQKQYSGDIKVVVLPHDVQIIDTKL